MKLDNCVDCGAEFNRNGTKRTRCDPCHKEYKRNYNKNYWRYGAPVSLTDQMFQLPLSVPCNFERDQLCEDFLFGRLSPSRPSPQPKTATPASRKRCTQKRVENRSPA